MPPLRNLASHWYITERWKPSARTTTSGLSPPLMTRWTARFLISARVEWESLRPSRVLMLHFTINVYLFTLGFVSALNLSDASETSVRRQMHVGCDGDQPGPPWGGVMSATTAPRMVHDLWPLGLMRARSGARAPVSVQVARPSSVEEVCDLLRSGRRVVPMGGGTGVCGALA